MAIFFSDGDTPLDGLVAVSLLRIWLIAFNNKLLIFQVYSLVYLLPLFTCLFFDCYL